jgi:hypothetical protein
VLVNVRDTVQSTTAADLVKATAQCRAVVVAAALRTFVLYHLMK